MDFRLRSHYRGDRRNVDRNERPALFAAAYRCACNTRAVTQSLTVAVGCRFGFNSEVPTHAIVQVEPCRTESFVVARESWAFDVLQTRRRGYRDIYGNLCQRIDIPAGASSLSYDALVDVPNTLDAVDWSAAEVAPGGLPDETLVYTLPSRYCLSDELADEAWRRFGALEPGWSRVQAIVEHVHNSLTWRAGSSTSRTTAVDAYASGVGVCRDFAHVAISFCRALNIPARYAFGYLPDIGVPPDGAAMDFAAWTEVWLGDRWYTFDPRNNASRTGRILIGRGRDALDCALLTSYGNAALETSLVLAYQVLEEDA
jgi:transglutaminase-like putative cysteine protease